MPSPELEYKGTKADGTMIFEYIDSAGMRKTLEVPIGYVYRWMGGEWQVRRGTLTPPPQPLPGLNK
jgi:hypothetical protein